MVSRFAGANCSANAAGNALLHLPARVGTVGSGYYIEIMIDHFSAFFLHGGVRALPVQLTSFSGEQVQQAIRLDWTTGSESANKGFAIERSVDGRSFDQIAWKNGQGTTAEQVEYTYLDADVPSHKRTYFYRLRQEDYNGDFTHSPIISVDFQIATKEWQVYPNPVSDQLNIQLPKSVYGGFILYNQLGQEVGRWTINGEPTLHISVKHLPAGGYWARCAGEDLPVLQLQIK